MIEKIIQEHNNTKSQEEERLAPPGMIPLEVVVSNTTLMGEHFSRREKDREEKDALLRQEEDKINIGNLIQRIKEKKEQK